MGVVYTAEQAHPKRLVALKVIRPMLGTREMVKRFRLEADVLGRLEHPGIARIYDAGSADDGAGPQPFFAMELVKGVPLRAAEKLRVRRLALPAPQPRARRSAAAALVIALGVAWMSAGARASSAQRVNELAGRFD